MVFFFYLPKYIAQTKTNPFQFQITISFFLFRSQNCKDDQNFINLLNVITSSQNGKPIGVFGNDDFPVEFCKSWQNAMTAHNFQMTDIGASIAYVMAVKDEYELITIKETLPRIRWHFRNRQCKESKLRVFRITEIQDKIEWKYGNPWWLMISFSLAKINSISEIHIIRLCIQ